MKGFDSIREQEGGKKDKRKKRTIDMIESNLLPYIFVREPTFHFDMSRLNGVPPNAFFWGGGGYTLVFSFQIA
jgi:hypothetical protein